MYRSSHYNLTSYPKLNVYYILCVFHSAFLFINQR